MSFDTSTSIYDINQANQTLVEIRAEKINPYHYFSPSNLGARIQHTLSIDSKLSASSIVIGIPPQDRIRTILVRLGATGSQLAGALNVSRARIYQIMDGENPGSETTRRLARLEKIALGWAAKQPRPMGMILPKPRIKLEQFWSLLNVDSLDEQLLNRLIVELSYLHDQFEKKEMRRATLSAGVEGTQFFRAIDQMI